MKYDIEQLLEAGEIIQIYPEGYSMYPMFVPGRDAAVIKKSGCEKNPARRCCAVPQKREHSGSAPCCKTKRRSVLYGRG